MTKKTSKDVPLICTVDTQVSKIKLDDRGCTRKAIFLNQAKKKYTKTRIDGCLIKHKTAADWLISQEESGQVIVELKGKDVDHATDQILETADFIKKSKLLAPKIAGLIVSTEYPAINTKVQRAQVKFATTFKGPLHVVTKNYEFLLENVLSFKGPFKKA